VIGLKQRGTLVPGSYDDLVLFDAAAEWKFRAAASRSKSKNTPFEGAAMLGRVRATICEGRVVSRS
jgi:dihydroorotase